MANYDFFSQLRFFGALAMYEIYIISESLSIANSVEDRRIYLRPKGIIGDMDETKEDIRKAFAGLELSVRRR